MDALSELTHCLRELSSNKASDRKKSAEKVKQLLNKGSVIQALDRYSDSRSSGRDHHLTWNHVLKGVFPYITIETEQLQKSKEAQSATARTNRQKKKQEISGLFKFVIRQADKRGPRLKCSLLLNHISNILQDNYTCSAYGLDYSNILLKNILTVRKYWTEIPSNTWQELITLFCKKYLEPDCSLDKILLARVIRSLINGAGGQCDLRPKRLLTFFSEVFKNIRQERTTSTLEHLMYAMNLFLCNIAENSRVQICTLGETIFVNILYLWNNRPSNPLKDEIIKFLQMQMNAHHPCGVKQQDEGSFAVDWDNWMSHVRKLYEMLYTDLQQLRGRNRFCGGSRESVLSPAYVDLAADLCNQLFANNMEAIEVTQLADTSQGGPGAKKRRLESGWAAIRDFLVNAGHTVHMIPWLQLVTRHVEKYPQNFPAEELLPYLSFMSSQLMEFKTTEVIHHLLFCIKAFIDSWKYFTTQERENCKSVVMAIWMSVLRMISLHHAVGPGFQLLCSIAEQKIIPIDKDIWSLFAPTVSSPCDDSIIFLQNFILKNRLPENHQSAVFAGPTGWGQDDQQMKQYPLRVQLLNWLIPGRERFSENSNMKPVKLKNPRDQAHLLALLVFKNPSVIKHHAREFQNESPTYFTSLEELYLQTTSGHFLRKSTNAKINKTLNNSDRCISIPFLLQKLLKMLQDEVNIEIMDADSSHLEEMSRQACSVAFLMYWLLEYGVYSPDTVHSTELTVLLRKLLDKLGKCLTSVMQKDGRNSVMKMLSWLQRMLQLDGCNCRPASTTVARLCRSLVSPKIIDQLTKLATEKVRKQNSRNDSDTSLCGSSRATFSHRRPIIQEDLDDMDIDFDDPPAHDQGEEFDDEFEESQKSDDANNEGNDFQSILSSSLLTEDQKVRMEAIKTLCIWCGYDRPDMQQEASYEMQVDHEEVKSKMVELLDQETYDPNKAFDLQMVKIIIETLTGSEYSVSDKHLETMIIAVRLAVKVQRQDQVVCCMCLEMLTCLTKYLSSDCDRISRILQECRESALKLMSAFWNLYEDGSYCSQVRLSIAKCLMAFIQNDPQNDWAMLTVNSTDKGADDQHASDEFVKILSDFCLRVRMYGAEAITRVFVCNGVPVDRKKQDEKFNKIYEEMLGLLDIQKNLSAERAQDERTNRTASVLCTIGSIICVSPICEKKALFAFCQLIKECSVETEKVQRIIEKVGEELGYRNGEHYVSKHLPYLLHHWLLLKYPVSEFPYKITSCDTREMFYSKYCQVIIPEIIMTTKDIDCAKNMVSSIKMVWLDTLKLCIPKIVVHILPLFAATRSAEESHDEPVKKRVAHATTCYNLLCKEASKEVVDRLIVSNIDEIVVNILMCLYDPDEDEFIKTENIRNLDPEPNPPCFNLYSTQSTLDYLTKSSGNKKSLVEVLSNTQDSIQKILLELSISLAREHRLHEKRRIMLMYRLFCKLLLKEFHTQLGGSWAYILREIIHRLVFTIKEMVEKDGNSTQGDGYTVNISCMALELLRDTCHMAVEVCPEELGKYLMFLVSSLVPVIEYSGDIGKQALQILSVLIIENCTVLSEAITALDPFPDSPVFNGLGNIYNKLKLSKGEKSLRQNIEHFIRLDEQSQVSADNRKEGLRYLAQQLHIQGSEISQLRHTGRGHSSLMSKLVSRLVRMGCSASLDDVRLEIGRCLGQIGPVDLGMEALPQMEDTDCGVLTEENPNQNYSKIFHMLDKFLTEEDMDTVQATSGVLKAMLRTETGLMFADQYITVDQTDHLLQYLHPFRPRKKSTPTSFPVNNNGVDYFIEMIDVMEVWNPPNSDHGQWIQNLACKLISSGAVKDTIMAHLGPICTRKTKFCEFLLPLLIHDMLASGSETHKDVLSTHISDFFMQHCVSMAKEQSGQMDLSSGSRAICLNKDSVRTMLSVVQYLRQKQRPNVGRKEMTAWDNNFWLDLNYLHVAKSALFCSAHFTAILCAEIWCDTKRLKKENSMKKSSQQSPIEGVCESFTQDTNIDSLSSDTPAVSINVQDLLLEAYRQIGDPDGLYGCGAGRLVDTTTRVKTYEHEDRWDKALVAYDIEMSSSTNSDVGVGMLQAIQNFGTMHLFGKCLHSVDVETCSSEMRDLQYEAAWRTGNWTLDSIIGSDQSNGFNEALYSGLHALKDGQLSVTKQAVNMARLRVMDKLRNASIESCSCLYPMLSELQCVSQLQQVQLFNVRDAEGLEELLELWKRNEENTYNEFEFVEPVYIIRCTILRLLQSTSRDEAVGICLQKELLDLVRSAIDANKHQIAERVIYELKSITTTDLKLQIPKMIEEAKLYWSRNEHNVAKYLMKNLINQLESLEDGNMDAAKLYPQVLSLYGNWLAETHSENPNVIMEEYLEKTIERMEVLGEEGDTSLDAYVSLARFADNQYQSIVNYMKSSTYEAKQNLMQKANQEIEKMEALEEDLSRDRYFRTLKKQSEIDQMELTTMEEDKEKFLLKAVENYLKCLKSGDKHDLRIFRLTSLWFSNSTIPDLNRLIQENIKRIKSYKFLCLMYQLCARMDVKSRHDQGLVLQATLNQVIERAAIDHPHHTLFCILALVNAKKDEEIFKKSTMTKRGSKLSRSGADVNSQDEGRIEAAKNLIHRLKTRTSGMADIVTKMENLCEAYIQLANFGVNQHRNETRSISLDKRLRITQINSLNNVAIPTAEIQIEPSCDYSSIVTLDKFEPSFNLAGGINLPKIITCVGSDGVGRRQLVKGKDDLRQDAVMQQVFEMLNNLLLKDKETRKRRLHVRQYKVIPLSQCSGLLEWCEGTLPIGEYLIGGKEEEKGAHRCYRPHDIRAMECRHSMAGQAKSSRTNPQAKLKVFLEVCSKFRPVFRYFFIEKFPQPSLWFERRFAYTKSVATTSIVGYILGLGDRHVQNILVDVNTAELIHIDLGIAFEQGRILPTPETVPFRLTRDIVDGMGVSGVEGVFRRCCEKTMEVMHNNQEALLTILEVLLYDPLNNWTMSPQKACALQNRRERNDVEASELNATRDILDATTSESVIEETQENVNKLAERVLLRLQQKLQGIEDGVQLSVAGQVNHLIQEARDPKNLSRLFAGWQPYI